MFEYIHELTSSSTRRCGYNEYVADARQQQREQNEATTRSIDETKNNIHRSIEEIRRELPRYSQTITDFQNETADASVEIADNFLESQKEVIHSMQSAWDLMSQSIGGEGGLGGRANYWLGGMMDRGGTTILFFSPREMTNIYPKTSGAVAEAYVASARMATNMMFAGLETTRATTNYARQNAKGVSRITSNTARAFAQTAKENLRFRMKNKEE